MPKQKRPVPSQAPKSQSFMPPGMATAFEGSEILSLEEIRASMASATGAQGEPTPEPKGWTAPSRPSSSVFDDDDDDDVEEAPVMRSRGDQKLHEASDKVRSHISENPFETGMGMAIDKRGEAVDRAMTGEVPGLERMGRGLDVLSRIWDIHESGGLSKIDSGDATGLAKAGAKDALANLSLIDMITAVPRAIVKTVDVTQTALSVTEDGRTELTDSLDALVENKGKELAGSVGTGVALSTALRGAAAIIPPVTPITIALKGVLVASSVAVTATGVLAGAYALDDLGRVVDEHEAKGTAHPEVAKQLRATLAKISPSAPTEEDAVAEDVGKGSGGRSEDLAKSRGGPPKSSPKSGALGMGPGRFNPMAYTSGLMAFAKITSGVDPSAPTPSMDEGSFETPEPSDISDWRPPIYVPGVVPRQPKSESGERTGPPMTFLPWSMVSGMGGFGGGGDRAPKMGSWPGMGGGSGGSGFGGGFGGSTRPPMRWSPGSSRMGSGGGTPSYSGPSSMSDAPAESQRGEATARRLFSPDDF